MSQFKLLWENYPDEDPCDATKENGKILFPNQCAIRVSHALKKSGISFNSFPKSRKCWVHIGEEHILAAKELADWLEKGTVDFVSKPRNITGTNWRDSVLNKAGIICFEDYYAPSGDHIDLWDGSSLTGFGSWLRTRFNIVVPGFWSDFRQSKQIRFFEVK